jgi:hypothetical protein
MLYDDLKGLAKRIGSYAVTLFALNKVAHIRDIIKTSDSPPVAAAKTSLMIAGVEFVADKAIFATGNTPPISFASLMDDGKMFAKHFVANAVSIYMIDTLNIDELIKPYAKTELTRAVAMAVIFTLANELSNMALHRFSLA